MRKIITFVFLTVLLQSLNSQDLTINFNFDEYQADKQTTALIDNFLKEQKPSKLILKGFADTTGSNSYNKKLAYNRLLTVQKIIRKFDPTIEMEIINYGEDKRSTDGIEFRKTELFMEKEIQALKPNYKKDIVYHINNTKDTIRSCKEGTKINIPKNAFVIKNTNTKPEGDIKISVTEYYNMHEILDANLTTTSNGEILETGGMLYIECMFDNLECVLADGKK